MVKIMIKSDKEYELLNDIIDVDTIWGINTLDAIAEQKILIEAYLEVANRIAKGLCTLC